jgi:polyhydroxyalkanoate synthesis repressor PhaR
MSTERIIKKYPNRRLYDTELRQYINRADVCDLVMSGTRVRVLDAAADVDLTRSILLQILFEKEASGGEPLFSADMLAQIILHYGGTLQGVFAHYLAHSVDVFVQQQQQLLKTWGATPVGLIDGAAQCSITLWADARKPFLRAAGLKSGAAAQPGALADGGHDAGDDPA